MSNYTCQIEGKNKYSNIYGGEVFESDFFAGYIKPTSTSSQLPRSPIAGRILKDRKDAKSILRHRGFCFYQTNRRNNDLFR